MSEALGVVVGLLEKYGYQAEEGSTRSGACADAHGVCRAWHVAES